jgi:hypothetical protein
MFAAAVTSPKPGRQAGFLRGVRELAPAFDRRRAAEPAARLGKAAASRRTPKKHPPPNRVWGKVSVTQPARGEGCSDLHRPQFNDKPHQRRKTAVLRRGDFSLQALNDLELR